jgi:hypothetical protein
MKKKSTGLEFHGSFAVYLLILFSKVFKAQPEMLVDKWNRLERKAVRRELR